MKLSKYTFLLLFVSILFIGCDLKVQKEFAFAPGTSELFTFGASTPWEWIQTNPGNECNYLIETIKHAGLEKEFSNITSKSTYF
ncbi:hypothetical protein [Polaribacter sp. L3A8]|uniref:hypothetical protein n=1 Tax=Polaribacter sp. L3A8 TaxID=2686361 RepID=UPI00131D885D|nr:hypothetical protein [Polaribacter sp. L3A8]